MDAVGGELGGKGEVKAACLLILTKLIGGGECGFCFAFAHGGFDDVEAGLSGGGEEAFLDRVRCGIRWDLAMKLLGEGNVWSEGGCELEGCYFFFGDAGDGGLVDGDLFGEPIGVGADPVGQNGEPGEEVEACLVAGGGFIFICFRCDSFRWEFAELLCEDGEEFLAESGESFF